MRMNTVNPMNEEEFEVYTRKIVDALGDDISGFFTVIRETFEYFTASDSVVENTEISLEEFEIMIEEIINVLGKKEAARFFKAIFDALQKKTVKYIGAMVKVFEKMFR